VTIQNGILRLTKYLLYERCCLKSEKFKHKGHEVFTQRAQIQCFNFVFFAQSLCPACAGLWLKKTFKTASFSLLVKIHFNVPFNKDETAF